jgi:hypothetical protein
MHRVVKVQGPITALQQQSCLPGERSRTCHRWPESERTATLAHAPCQTRVQVGDRPPPIPSQTPSRPGHQHSWNQGSQIRVSTHQVPIVPHCVTTPKQGITGAEADSVETASKSMIHSPLPWVAGRWPCLVPAPRMYKGKRGGTRHTITDSPTRLYMRHLPY